VQTLQLELQVFLATVGFVVCLTIFVFSLPLDEEDPVEDMACLG
jgi:hypothetical protein